MNELQIIEHQKQRVLLTQQLAESYGTDNKSISYNFNHNKDRYQEGKHYFLLQGDDLKAFREFHDLPHNLNKVYLWTERGAFLHAKSLNTDRAWEVYDSLVEHYFDSKEEKQSLLPTNYKEALLQLVAQVEANEKLELENKVKSQQIAELEPKASYYDVVLNCKDLLSISVIAKDYGWSAIRLNEYLHKKGVQFKQGKTWLLYQKYAVEGYTSTKTHEHLGNDGTNHTNVHTYWTQKGRLFIYDLLKSDGIVPLIERDHHG